MAKLTHEDKDALIKELRDEIDKLTRQLGAVSKERDVALAKLHPQVAERRPVTFPRQPFYTAFDRDHATAACRAAARARGHAVSFKPINTPRGIAFALF